MFTFANGLVLRIGERTCEFERQLEFDKVQFKYQDNHEVQTFSIARLYAGILNKEIGLVSQNGYPVNLPSTVPGGACFSPSLSPHQEALLTHREKYVKAARRKRIHSGSYEQCRILVQEVQRKIDEEIEEKIHALLKVRTGDLPAEFKFPAPSPGTLKLWLKKYKQASDNIYALLDRRAMVRHEKRLPARLEEAVEKAIQRHYLQLHGKSAKTTHEAMVRELAAKDRASGTTTQSPSLRTVTRRINEIDPYVRDFKRMGPAMARHKWRFSLAGDQSTRILQRVEIDHTQLDIWALDPRSGMPIGRPWITVVLDRFSGYPLGIYISFYGPSVSTVAHAIKNSITPKSEMLAAFPDIKVEWTALGVAELYVVDNGLEFHAQAFRQLMWGLSADILYNPVRQPWLKASVERSMMEFNRMLPSRGKVHPPTKNADPSDPAASAAILFDDLVECVLHWAVAKFPYQIHPKTLVRPIDLWEEERSVSLPPQLTPCMANFDIISGVNTDRTVDGDGVLFSYLRFNSYELQNYRRNGGNTFRTEIRINPDNLGSIHVHLPREKVWLKVPLQRPGPSYGEGLSLIQHEIIRKEAGKRLTQANAVEVLQQAETTVQSRWQEAIQKGIKVRKHANLIRLQGLSSANIVNAASTGSTSAPLTQPLANIPPEASSITKRGISEAVSFSSFNIDEEFA